MRLENPDKWNEIEEQKEDYESYIDWYDSYCEDVAMGNGDYDIGPKGEFIYTDE